MLRIPQETANMRITSTCCKCLVFPNCSLELFPERWRKHVKGSQVPCHSRRAVLVDLESCFVSGTEYNMIKQGWTRLQILFHFNQCVFSLYFLPFQVDSSSKVLAFGTFKVFTRRLISLVLPHVSWDGKRKTILKWYNNQKNIKDKANNVDQQQTAKYCATKKTIKPKLSIQARTIVPIRIMPRWATWLH